MRSIALTIALPIAICFASYGCAASDESAPAGGNPSTGGAGFVNHAGSGSVVSAAGASPVSSGGSPGAAGSITASAGNVSASGSGMLSGGASPGAGGAAAVAACTATAMASGTPPMIDDLEDGNADVGAADGRVGGWYFSTDTSGTTTPLPGAAMPVDGGMPGKALHVSGSGLSGWGASLSASITPANACYDASKFTGVTVSLKGSGMVWVSVLTAAVRGAPDGMRNQYKKQIVLTDSWTTVTVNFSELTQPGGWGVQVPFDATKVYGIDFGPATATAPATTAFDFWVDNLSFK
jgi:hypothetical protein